MYITLDFSSSFPLFVCFLFFSYFFLFSSSRSFVMPVRSGMKRQTHTGKNIERETLCFFFFPILFFVFQKCPATRRNSQRIPLVFFQKWLEKTTNNNNTASQTHRHDNRHPDSQPNSFTRAHTHTHSTCAVYNTQLKANCPKKVLTFLFSCDNAARKKRKRMWLPFGAPSTN